ncbi:MAG TPA: hypothetical protein VG755_33510 [Nannocystaceae bacterium]|nr:hypothetical protein [Nannocystaceae bacterium]
MFERACSEWAARNELESDDGLYLAELEKTAATLAELAEALEVCGQSRADVTRAVGRLVDARLVVLSP